MIIKYFTNFIRSKQPIGQGPLGHDLIIVIPFFFCVGMSIESFMFYTGFYRFRTRREGLRKAIRIAEYEESKERIALKVLKDSYDIDAKSDIVKKMREEQLKRIEEQKLQQQQQQHSITMKNATVSTS